jgi:hypothetical protein
MNGNKPGAHGLILTPPSRRLNPLYLPLFNNAKKYYSFF